MTKKNETKKVFSAKVFATDSVTEEIYASPELAIEHNNWAVQCDGKTVEECEAMHYGIHPNWLVDEADFVPLQMKEHTIVATLQITSHMKCADFAEVQPADVIANNFKMLIKDVMKTCGIGHIFDDIQVIGAQRFERDL